MGIIYILQKDGDPAHYRIRTKEIFSLIYLLPLTYCFFVFILYIFFLLFFVILQQPWMKNMRKTMKGQKAQSDKLRFVFHFLSFMGFSSSWMIPKILSFFCQFSFYIPKKIETIFITRIKTCRDSFTFMNFFFFISFFIFIFLYYFHFFNLNSLFYEEIYMVLSFDEWSVCF